jgi:integrase
VHAIIGQCSARSATGIRNRALLTLLYRSGLRIAEALALKPSDIDVRRHTARVLHGKGDKATVRGFHPSATDAVARWVDTRRTLGLRNGPLFCTLGGGPIYPQYVRALLGRLAAQAGSTTGCTRTGCATRSPTNCAPPGSTWSSSPNCSATRRSRVTSRYLDHLTNHQAVSALETVDLPPLEDS